MLSPLLQKLMFVKQFKIAGGKVELLGNNYIMMDASQFIVLQDIDKTKAYTMMKDISGKQLANLVEHAKVYKGVKDTSLKNIGELSKKVGQSDEGTIKTLQEIFNVYGFGEMTIQNLDNTKKTALVAIKDSTVAAEWMKNNKKKAKNGVCTLTAGVIAGIFSYIFGKEVNCVEESCKALGDEYCLFKIG